MKNLYARIFAAAASLAIPLLTPLAAQAQNWQWVARTHARSGEARTCATATDVAGNTYVVGMLSGDVHFGALTVRGAVGGDGFVAKLDVQGQWQWVRTVPTPGRDGLASVAVLASGDVVVTGYINSIPAPIMLGSSTLIGPAPVDSLWPSTYTTYVARLSAGGAWQWATQVDATSHSVGPASIVVDAADNAYVCGSYIADGVLNFGTATLPGGVGENRSFVASINPLGQWRWANNPPGPLGAGSMYTLAVGANTLYAGGEYISPPLVPQFSPKGSHAVLAAFDPATGANRWTRRDTALAYMPNPRVANYYLPVGRSSIHRLATDDAGNAIMLGHYYGHIALEGFVLPQSGFVLEDDYVGTSFLARINPQGTAVAAPLIARSSYVTLPDILAVGTTGDAIVGGEWGWMQGGFCGSGNPGGGGSSPPSPIIQDTLWLGSQRLVGQESAGYVAWTQNGQWQGGTRAMAVRALTTVGSGGEFVAAGDLLTDMVLGAASLTLDSLQQVVVARFNPAAPVLTAVSSPGGLVGTALTLTGTNFTGATQVLFNGVTATFTVVNGTTITVTVPVGATTGLITVLTPQGGASSPQVFQVGSPLGLSADVATRLALWPNPAHDLARLTIGETATDVTLLDGVGRVVRTIPNARGTVALPLADLPAGTYTVRAGARVARLIRQ